MDWETVKIIRRRMSDVHLTLVNRPVTRYSIYKQCNPSKEAPYRFV